MVCDVCMCGGGRSRMNILVMILNTPIFQLRENTESQVVSSYFHFISGIVE